VSGFIASLVFFVLMIAAILYFLLSRPRGFRPRAILISSLAGRWNGKVREGSIFGGDSLDLSVDGIPGEVTFGESTNSDIDYGGWTRVRFDWKSDRRLRVAPEGFETRLRRLLGSNDIEFDDPYFDDRFWVESSHPSWARQILTRDTRVDLVQLRWAPAGGAGDDVMLDVGPQGLTLRVNRVVVDNPESLGKFIDLAVAVLQAMRRLAEPTGFVLDGLSIAGSACPICGHAITDDPLACPTCRTPHHRDCWKYFGGCAIFGCSARSRVRRS
jgi:hypothetical protein